MRWLPHSRRHGFTLVEILMVLAIMGIMTIVTMPSLVKSIRGNRLRVGSRTIVMAANYARTSAILRNQEMKLTLNAGNNQVSVDPLRSAPPALPGDQVFQAEASAVTTNAATEAEADSQANAAPFTSITRTLDAVKIESFSVEGKKGGVKDESGTVVYQSNGRCTPFEATVVDEFGSRMIITVDGIGSIKVVQKGE